MEGEIAMKAAGRREDILTAKEPLTAYRREKRRGGEECKYMEWLR